MQRRKRDSIYPRPRKSLLASRVNFTSRALSKFSFRAADKFCRGGSQIFLQLREDTNPLRKAHGVGARPIGINFSVLFISKSWRDRVALICAGRKSSRSMEYRLKGAVSCGVDTIITKRVGRRSGNRDVGLRGFLGIDRNKKESSIYDSILGLETMEEILFTVRLLFSRHLDEKTSRHYYITSCSFC